jgi:hypothetical protein
VLLLYQLIEGPPTLVNLHDGVLYGMCCARLSTPLGADAREAAAVPRARAPGRLPPQMRPTA